MLKTIQAFTPSLSEAWTLLAIAITFEVMGTTCMKLSQGFTRPVPSVAMFAFYGLAFACNTIAIKTLDLSITYAVWSGVGTIATAIIGIYFFKEVATALKLASISLIVVGVFGLHAASRMQLAEKQAHKPATLNSGQP
jgi:small multidrug resistance pump